LGVIYGNQLLPGDNGLLHSIPIIPTLLLLFFHLLDQLETSAIF
jgi:hypothetical protein